jgi:hypothetical protein
VVKNALKITRIAAFFSFNGYRPLQLKYDVTYSALENKNGLWTYNGHQRL